MGRPAYAKAGDPADCSQLGYGFAYLIRFLWEEATAELPSEHPDPRRGVPNECVIYVGPGEGKSHAISPAQPHGMDDEGARRWVHGELERLQRERKGSAAAKAALLARRRASALLVGISTH